MFGLITDFDTEEPSPCVCLVCPAAAPIAGTAACGCNPNGLQLFLWPGEKEAGQNCSKRSYGYKSETSDNGIQYFA